MTHQVQNFPKQIQGTWTKAQNNRFIKGLQLFGRNWPMVQKKVKTRTLSQVRSHAQKMFLKMKKQDIDALFGERDDPTEQSNFLENLQKNSHKDSLGMAHLRSSKRKDKMESQTEKKGNQAEIEKEEEDSKENRSKEDQTVMDKTMNLSGCEEKERQSMFMKIFLGNLSYFQGGGNFLPEAIISLEPNQKFGQEINIITLRSQIA